MTDTLRKNENSHSLIDSVKRLGDTIFAECTPPGKGGVSMIRISGSESFVIAEKIFRASNYKKDLSFGYFFDSKGTFDTGIAIKYHSPHSYTGDDSVELCSHGSPVIVKRILSALHKNGGRHALRGEFTERSYLNGKMDLSSAEAVHSLIDAENESDVEISFNQLSGGLSNIISEFKDSTIEIMTEIEGMIDFPEDIEENANVYESIASLQNSVKKLLSGSLAANSRLHTKPVVIAGLPNSGKSSLYNALLGENKAIISSVAGTTRDVLTSKTDINGLTVEIADTAGIRECANEIEKEGVHRAEELIRNAAIVLWVVDGSIPWSSNIKIDFPHRVIVINKSDLPQIAVIPQELKKEKILSISSITLDGIDELKSIISENCQAVRSSEISSPIATKRSEDNIREASAYLEDALINFKNGYLDMTGECLRQTVISLQQITGEIDSEEIVESIFRRFCLGK